MSSDPRDSYLRCLCLNACSLVKTNAVDILHSYITANNIDITFVTETWFSETNMCDSELNCDDKLQIFRCDRKIRGGGILILVKSNITCCSVMINHDADVEILAIDVVFNTVKIRFVCIYFSPAGSSPVLNTRMKKLCDILEDVCDVEHSCYVTGDINLPLINWKYFSCPGQYINTKESIFLDTCVSLGLTQHVTEPTLVKSGNVLGVLLTNDDSLLKM